MTASPPAVTVLYDADCGFCRFTLALLLRWDRRLALLPEPIQGRTGAALLAGIPAERRLATAHAVAADGRVFSGGDAVGAIARVLPGGIAVAAWPAELLPGPTRLAYRFVAGNRGRLGRLVSPAMRERATAAIDRHRDRVLASRGT